MEPIEKRVNKVEFSLPKEITGMIISDSPFIWGKEASLLAQAYIPGIKDLDTHEAYRDIVISHTEYPVTRIEYSGTQVALDQQWNGKMPLDLFHLLYSMSRVSFLEQQCFPLHGACVGNEQGYNLIVGHSGVGKSSLALQLVKDAGMKMFSGNKTLLNFDKEKMYAIAGTRTMTIKDEDEYRWQGLIHNALNYWGRIAFELNENQYSIQNEVPISKIFVPKINDKLEEKKEISPMSAMHMLYPFIMDKVNADTIIGDTIYIGNVSPATEDYLVKALKSVLKDIPVYGITGPMNYLVEQVTKS
jgi:hypothetical protein